RAFVFISIVPALVALVIIKRKKVKPLPTYIFIYLASGIIFFLSPFISPKLNLPELVSSRQAAFIQIAETGESVLESRSLKPTLAGFIQNAPEAFNHVLMRP